MIRTPSSLRHKILAVILFLSMAALIMTFSTSAVAAAKNETDKMPQGARVILETFNASLRGNIANLERLIAVQEQMKIEAEATLKTGAALRDGRLKPEICRRFLSGKLCDELNGTFRRP